MRIKVDTTGYDEATKTLETLGKDGIQVIRRSVKRAAKGVAIDSGREVRKLYPVPVAKVRKTFRYGFAKDGLQATARSTGKKISLINFGARPNTVEADRRLRRGISVIINRTRGREVFRHAFIARLNHGNTHVVERRSKKRLPVDRLEGNSIPQMIGQPEIVAHVQNGAKRRFVSNLSQGIDFLLSRKKR